MNKVIGSAIGFIIIYFVFFGNNYLDTLTEPTTQEKNYQSGLKVVETADAYSLAEYGMFTVVEFYTEVCSACKEFKRYYDMFLPLRPDVAVRRIKLPNNWTIETASAKYNLDIRATPHILIFDKTGTLMAEDEGMGRDASKLLFKWMAETVNKKT